MYAYQQNILSIPAKLLYEDWKLVTYENYNTLCRRKQLIRTKEGKGKGNTPWVSFKDLPIHNGVDFKEVCLKKLGPPAVTLNHLEPLLIPDTQAIKFFAEHRKPNGKPLSLDDQVVKTTNAIILNGIQMVLKDRALSAKLFKQNTKDNKVWENISKAVNALNIEKWKKR